MSLFSVIAAGVVAWLAGAIWYGVLAKSWVAVSGVKTDENGKPANQKEPMPYIISIVAAIVVAGMVRHTFNLSGIDTVGKGLVSGFGIGAFLAAPWIATNYGFAGRPFKLILIDSGYAILGCTVIGTVLTLF